MGVHGGRGPLRVTRTDRLGDGAVTGEGVVRSSGLAQGLQPRLLDEVADLVHAITGEASLDGESVRNVRMLERFAFVEVPEGDVDRVVERVSGTTVRGHELRLERVGG